MFYTKVLLQV